MTQVATASNLGTTPCYIRWKQRSLCRDPWLGGFSLTAILVESQRVNGKPRQRYVRYLASIRVNELSVLDGGVSPQHVVRFWRDIDRVLDRLNGRLNGCRPQVEASVARVLPRLDPETEVRMLAESNESLRKDRER